MIRKFETSRNRLEAQEVQLNRQLLKEIKDNANLTQEGWVVKLLYPRVKPYMCKRMQHCWPTTPNIIECYMFCCMLLRVVAQSLKLVKLLSQQLLTFLLFCDRCSVQQCWIHLHSSCNIVGAMHAHYTWSPMSYGLYHSHNALQVSTLLGVIYCICFHTTTHIVSPTILGVVVSVCT